MKDHIELTDLEHDALTELVNIGVSRAASSLRKMIGEEVLLSVPSIEIMAPQNATRLIRERETDELVAIQQQFEGAFSGRALLIFPEATSLDLVRAIIGSDVPLDQVADMEQEALAETGNIILNGCLATMANMLKQSLNISLPEVIRGDGAALFSLPHERPDEGLVLFLYINFSIRNRNIRGYIAMLMDLPSLAALKELIAGFIERVIGDEA
ncbi:chemotaxis protein CheX [Microvirga sp. 3-52]|jgi:chemotaxis protein CheC|uniref:chemotaxis protein CheX n=1 Tax=Microvirga sp. 3-52 TaxID=2792425 RepID=UPI001AC55EAD|nr:chemotaxis protein CheX [Microvirga sp. 3-52]MBO1907685.1 chemotaxis protein CheX [Microvirga sp. 3-52]MBS7454540.1 chemotaxis protein CheX [Microvirga sp. 3-52]